MPKWIHDRARHIQAKNQSMPESMAFALATQQSHALGKSPKGYGTAEGRETAKTKYDTPKDDKKTADPGGIGKEMEKEAQLFFSPAYFSAFADEFVKIAMMPVPMAASTPQDALAKPKVTAPKPAVAGVRAPSGPAKVNAEPARAPNQQHHPVLGPPPVRR